MLFVLGRAALTAVACCMPYQFEGGFIASSVLLLYAQGVALAEEMSRVQRQAESAADRLESLLKERDTDRKHLTEVQLALQEAMQHLEAISEAEVMYHFRV